MGGIRESMGEGALDVIEEEAIDIMKGLKQGCRCSDAEHDKIVQAVRHNFRMNRMIIHAHRKVGRKAAIGAAVGSLIMQLPIFITYILWLRQQPAGTAAPPLPGVLSQAARFETRSTP